MPHQDKSQKCYLDLGINLEWPNANESNINADPHLADNTTL